MTTQAPVRYKRILVKLSGEALMGSSDYGIDPQILKRIALEIQELLGLGVQVAVSSVAATSSAARVLRARGWIASRAITWACWPRS